jgi:hypothetical protein
VTAATLTARAAQFEFGQALASRPDRLLVGAAADYPRARDVRLMMWVHQPTEPVFMTLDELLAAMVEEVRRRADRGYEPLACSDYPTRPASRPFGKSQP